MDRDLLAGLELDHVLHRDHDLEDAVLHVPRRHDVEEVGAHLVLVARIGVHHIPAAGTVERARRREFLLGLPIVLVELTAGVGGCGGVHHDVGLEAFDPGLDLGFGLLGLRFRFGVLGLVQVVDCHLWNMYSTVFPKPRFKMKISETMSTRVVTTTAV